MRVSVPYHKPCSFCHSVESVLYSRTSTNGYLSTRATILADSPYIDSCLNLSTKATFICPQGGLCGEVQLYFLSFIGLLYLGYSVFTLHGMYKEKENAAHCSTANARHHDKVWMKTK